MTHQITEGNETPERRAELYAQFLANELDTLELIRMFKIALDNGDKQNFGFLQNVWRMQEDKP